MSYDFVFFSDQLSGGIFRKFFSYFLCLHRKMAENIDHYRNQIATARTEIKNLRQQLSSLKHEHMKEIKVIKTKLESLRCFKCSDNATTHLPTTSDQPSASSASPSDVIHFHPIGIIETSFQNKRGVPRQPSVLAKAKGAIVINQNVFNNPEHALSGLEEFSHMWIIFHFHTTESNSAVPAKVAPPRLGGERRGVFATRAPHRPCPIGLSLVKIQSIEGNKIHFLGVDMVNGTPVLDIKPYIPQYDYPPPGSGEIPMAALVRPPTEGISDVTDSVVGLQVEADGFGVRSLSPCLANPTGLDTSTVNSPYEDEIPPPYEDHTSDPITPVTPSDSPSGDLLDGMRSPVRRLDTERGAPDGQERFTPPQSVRLASMTHDGIRVASWITNPPSQTFEVRFTDDVNDRLTDLISERAPAFKTSIQSLLAEDPRSNYVRTRYPDHEYSCVLEDLSISCVFDSNSSVCTIVAVRTAEDMQQS